MRDRRGKGGDNPGRPENQLWVMIALNRPLIVSLHMESLTGCCSLFCKFIKMGVIYLRMVLWYPRVCETHSTGARILLYSFFRCKRCFCLFVGICGLKLGLSTS